MASLIAEFVFEVMTNDDQDDGVFVGNYAGAALGFKSDHNESQGSSNREKIKKKNILSTLIPHKGFSPSHFTSHSVLP